MGIFFQFILYYKNVRRLKQIQHLRNSIALHSYIALKCKIIIFIEIQMK